MHDFRALSGELDSSVFDALADQAAIAGRPVRGMFSSPWLAPQLGRLDTGLIEPQLIVRDLDAVDVAKGTTLSFDGQTFEVVGVEPDGTGVTALILRPLS
ncbi:hypothetical protein QZN00_29295 [Burkholderia multivorans]|nr:hypothetical protein [Burkholderia multivorans]